MITAIVPAAGRSQRMGTTKLLLPLAGTTVIGCVSGVAGAGYGGARRPGRSRRLPAGPAEGGGQRMGRTGAMKFAVPMGLMAQRWVHYGDLTLSGAVQR